MPLIRQPLLAQRRNAFIFSLSALVFNRLLNLLLLMVFPENGVMKTRVDDL